MAETKTQETKTVRVYNRGSRSFLHAGHKLDGGTFAEVPQEVATLWQKMFPLDVIEAQQAHKELGGMGAELAEVRAELVAAKARIAELEALVPKGKGKGNASADV